MKRTFIAAAVLLAASGTAFAHHHKDPFIFNATIVSDSVDVDGNVRIFGCVHVSSTAGAVVNNTQSVWADATLNPPPSTYTKGTITKTIDNEYHSASGHGFHSRSEKEFDFTATASASGMTHSQDYTYQDTGVAGTQTYDQHDTAYNVNVSIEKEKSKHEWAFSKTEKEKNVSVTGSVTTYIDTQKPGELDAMTQSGAGSGSSGNIGVNIAEGVDNAQSNDVSLASVDAGDVFGNAQIFNKQSSGGSAHIHNFMLNASVGDQSLQNVSGNIGVNVAAGVGNVQNNSLAASTATMNPGSASAVAMVASDQNDQEAKLDFKGSFSGTANLGSGALQNSMGNIGVNIAGGAGNVQHNGLAIAALNVSKQ